MAQWGIAYAFGPNYNVASEAERDAQAYAAIEKAQRYARRATPAEQDYIAALSKRYSATPETADRKRSTRRTPTPCASWRKSIPTIWTPPRSMPRR